MTLSLPSLYQLLPQNVHALVLMPCRPPSVLAYSDSLQVYVLQYPSLPES